MKLQNGQKSYKSAENWLGKGEKATVILAEPQVLNNGTMWLKVRRNTWPQGMIYTSFDGAEDVHLSS